MYDSFTQQIIEPNQCHTELCSCITLMWPSYDNLIGSDYMQAPLYSILCKISDSDECHAFVIYKIPL